MPETVRRERFGPWLPAEPDRPAELAIPHPADVAGQSWNGRPIGESDRFALRVPVDEACNEGLRITSDSFQVFARCRLAAHVVRRPASLECCDVAVEIFHGGPDKVHVP